MARNYQRFLEIRTTLNRVINLLQDVRSYSEVGEEVKLLDIDEAILGLGKLQRLLGRTEGNERR